MKKLIELDAALSAIGEVPTYNDGMVFEALSHAQRDVELLPTVDAAPVRHGQWKRHYCEDDGLPDGWQCTACGEWYYFGENKPNYCPNCGARMDGKDGKDGDNETD